MLKAEVTYRCSWIVSGLVDGPSIPIILRITVVRTGGLHIGMTRSLVSASTGTRGL